MITGQGGTLQGATLTQMGARKTSTDGVKGDGVFGTDNNNKAPNVVECYEDGTIEVTWLDGSTEDIEFTSGWVNPIDCKSIKISSGVFNLAWV